MSRTLQACGPHAVAAYIDDGQGRRVIVGTPSRGAVEKPVLLAETREEARQVIAVLRQLAEELPGEEPIRLGGREGNER